MNATLPNEPQRLETLRDYDVLDTPPETDFDELAILASQICQTPVAAISFIDESRQWFKSKIGLSVSEYPRSKTFCAHTLLSSEKILAVHDTRLDPRFADTPLVTATPAIIFYAGAVLTTDNGFALGTLCVMDFKPRVLSDAQIVSLQALARQAVTLLELRKFKRNQIQYEPSVHKSDVCHQDLVENSSDLIQVCDSTGSLLYANQAWCDTLGYSKKEVTNLTLQDILHPNSLNHYMVQLQQLANDNQYSPMVAVFQTKKGHKVYIEGCSAYRIEAGKHISTQSIFRDITHRRQADKARDHIFNYSPDLYCTVGFDGYFKQVNPAWENTLGWNSKELVSRPYIEFIHPDDHESTVKAVATVKDGNSVLLSENRYLCKDGSYRWLSWFAYPEAEYELLYAVARDITNQKIAEAQLQAIAEQQRAILKNAGHAIISTTADGIITSFNPAAEHMLGYSSAEVIGLQTPTLFHDHSEVTTRANEFSAELGTAITPGFEVFIAKAQLNLPNEHEWTYIRKDGTRIPVILSITALRNSEGVISGFLGMAIDITERKLAEAQFRLVVEASPNGLVMINQYGIITLVNKQIEILFNYSRTELIGLPIENLLPERFRAAHPEQRHHFFANSEVRAMGNGRDLFGQRKDGSEFPLEIGLSPLHTPAGDFVLASVTNITERKHAEQLLRSKNEELKSFAYTVSHDLKAPLRGISGYAQEMERRHQVGLTERAQFCIGQIITASHNLDNLIEDLLTYSRVDSEVLAATEVDLSSLVTSIMRDRSLVVAEQGIEITIDVPVIILNTWERGLHQVLTNLIDNAIKYSRNSKPPCLSINAEKTSSTCLIVVKDNGVGFDMKYHDRIFGLFNRLVRTDEFEGTGAGLAIVIKLLNKLSGTIRAESSPSKGASFFVELPITVSGKHLL